MTHRQAVGLMVLVTLLWSIAGVVTRHLDSARSFEVTFWRSFFTALSLAIGLLAWRDRGTVDQPAWRRAYAAALSKLLNLPLDRTSCSLLFTATSTIAPIPTA